MFILFQPKTHYVQNMSTTLSNCNLKMSVSTVMDLYANRTARESPSRDCPVTNMLIALSRRQVSRNYDHQHANHSTLQTIHKLHFLFLVKSIYSQTTRKTIS